MVAIREFEDEDEAGVVDLLGVCFGLWPLGIDGVPARDFFSWKHSANPFGRSLMVVGESGGRVVAFAAWLRWRLRIGDEVIEAMRGVDFCVHPSHRGHGLQVELINFAQERFPANLALTFSTPNELSRPGALRAGRGRVGPLRRFVRATHPVRGAARMISPTSSEQRGRPRVAADSAADVLAEGERISRFIEAVPAPGDRLATARGLDYLSWRYGRFPDYRAVRIETGGELVGLAIFRMAHGKVWKSSVCELLVRDHERGVARQLLDQVATRDVDAIVCSFPSPREAARCGFVPAPGGRVLLARPRRELCVDPGHQSAWALSIGDEELL
jgi:GNAT superfamily N-acetyltransferase